MTQNDALLNNLSEWRPAGTGPHSFGHTLDTGWTVAVTADAADTVGCRLTELAVARPVPAKPVQPPHNPVRDAFRIHLTAFDRLYQNSMFSQRLRYWPGLRLVRLQSL